MWRLMFFNNKRMENQRIEREIRSRSASNMQNVWNQLIFAQKMDEDEGCKQEADEFIDVFAKLLLKHISDRQNLSIDEVESLSIKFVMNKTAIRADELAGFSEKRLGLIQKAIKQFLFNCRLIDHEDCSENSPYVKDVTEWWFGKLGNFCSSDERFWAREFIDWVITNASFYFLMNYHVHKDLLKNYVESWELQPSEILQSSVEFRNKERVEEYLEQYNKASDREMANNSHMILQNEACMVYHDKLLYVTKMLGDCKMYEEMADLFENVDYPVLQAFMLLEIKNAEDLLNLTEVLTKRVVNHPLTIYSLIKEYLYDLCARTTANLLSYQYGDYGYEPVNGLEEKWNAVYEKWGRELPKYLSVGLGLLKTKLEPKDLAGWAFTKQEIAPLRKNANSDGYNKCTRVLKEEVLKIYVFDELPVIAGDLQYLLYIGRVYLASDTKPEHDSYCNLFEKITETVCTTKILPIYAINDKLIADSDVAARILCENFPDKQDLFVWFERHKTWYEGWNVKSAELLYESCYRECYFLCWMLMVASLGVLNESECKEYWDMVMNSLFGQIRAAGYYYKKAYRLVIVLAGMIAVQTYQKGLTVFLDNCCKYVIDIDDLVMIINNSGATRLLKGDVRLLNNETSIVREICGRIETEWPLKKIKIEMKNVQETNKLKALGMAAEEWLSLIK